jgi:hypothetical protein
MGLTFLMFKDWLEARKNSPHLNKIVHPFDWTFSTDYAGTVTYTQVSTRPQGAYAVPVCLYGFD